MYCILYCIEFSLKCEGQEKGISEMGYNIKYNRKKNEEHLVKSEQSDLPCSPFALHRLVIVQLELPVPVIGDSSTSL